MAKKSKAKGSASETEIEPGAWERFERAVDVVAKSPPQPKKTGQKHKKAQRKKQSVAKE